MSRYTNIVYVGGYLVVTYIKRFISTACCFFSYICWSVKCMSWVSKFNNFFLLCTETEVRFAFEGFHSTLYGKFISDSLILFRFLYLVCKLFRGPFQSLCQSVNCTSWVFESWNIPRRCHVTKALIYICNFVVFLFMEKSISIVSTISNFSGL